MVLNPNYRQTKMCLRVPRGHVPEDRRPSSKLLCVVLTSILQYAGGVIEHMNEIETIDFCQL